MKKLTLFFVVSVFFFNSIKAQDVKQENVARECVLYEIFTGVGCPNCPGVALGMAKMLEEGKDVAVVAYHTDAYSTPNFYTNETNSRSDYYRVVSYPTVMADGALCVKGGGPASYADGLYQSYFLPKYNQAISKTSPFTIDLSVEYDSGTQCKAVATVNKVGECTDSNVRLFMVLTESNIEYTWHGLDELNFVVRDMIPSHNGIAMTDEVSCTFEELFDIDGLDRNNCEIVAWVQNYSTKEVYQTVKISMADIPVQNDIRIVRVDDMVTATCANLMSPRITLKNHGEEVINSVVFEFKHQDLNVFSSHTWEGSLAKGETTEVVVSNLDIESSTNVIIEAVEVNGVADDFPADNIKVIDITSAPDVRGYIKFQIKTGSNPEELVINLRNMDTNEIVDNFVYDKAKKIFEEDIYLPETGCFRMEFLNETGKGMNGGIFVIEDADEKVVFNSGPGTNEFKNSLYVDIYSSTVVGLEDVRCDDVNIYPNPATSIINISAANMKNVSIYNVMGQLVYNIIAESDNIKINTDSWTNGMYYVNVETVDGKNASQKIIVNK